MSEKKYRIKCRINNVKVNYRIPKNRFKKIKRKRKNDGKVQNWIAQLEGHWLGTGEVLGSN